MGQAYQMRRRIQTLWSSSAPVLATHLFSMSVPVPVWRVSMREAVGEGADPGPGGGVTCEFLTSRC